MLLIMKLSLIFCLSSIVSCQSDENAKGGGRGKYWNYLFNNIILIKLFFKGKSEITTLDGVFYRFNGNGEYTFMEIEILAWIFEVLIWNLHPNWIIIPQKKTLIFIADKSKSFFFGVCLSR